MPTVLTAVDVEVAMARTLRFMSTAMGASCVAIGAMHLLGGTATVPGESGAGATVDSRERFYAAIFGGYGLAWLWAARQQPVPAPVVRALAATFWVGGAGRLVSLGVHGRPHWFQDVLTAVEVALPPVYLWLADADEREQAGLTRPVQAPASSRSS